MALAARDGRPSFHSYRTPFGRITIQARDDGVTRLVLGDARLEGVDSPSPLLNEAATQVNEYLAGKRTLFDVPVRLSGTDFQNAVWRAAMDIPYGQTRTPSDIAAAIGSPGAFRSVGRAVSQNPIAIIVPAHRIAKEGEGAVDGSDAAIRTRFRELERRYS